MAAIGGTNLGLITGYAIMDQETGEVKSVSELFAGGGGTAGPKGDKGDKGDTGPAGAAGSDGEDGVGITNIASSQNGNVVTLTFTMSDSTMKTVTFDLPTSV